MQTIDTDRRRFLKLSATAVGASLVLGINWSCTSNDGQDSSAGSDDFVPNAWLRISSDNSVTVVVAESEMGQGPYTLMPMMVAEELEVGWDQIKVERASIDPIYGYQFTGGSSSIRKGWAVLRQAGAVAREILVQAAAKQFSVPAANCRAIKGVFYDKNSDKKLSFGELVGFTHNIPVPGRLRLKEFGEFSIIGKPVYRKDSVEKINGTAVFGIDVDLPDMIHATVVHCPVFGGHVKSINADRSLKIKGAIDVFPIKEGVALVGEDTWTTFKMARDVNIEWNNGGQENFSFDEIVASYKNAAGKPEKIIENFSGKEFISRKDRVFTSHYLQPFQAHMTMEPMNCTVHFRKDGKLDIWAPTQSPSAAYDTARQLTESKLERGIKKIGYKVLGGYDRDVNVHTTLLGGGFGRRLKQDYVSEAVQIAEHYNRPVKLTWRREEDIQHDYYHPASFHEMKAELNTDGYPVAWQHTIKGDDVSQMGAKHLYDIERQRIVVYNVYNDIPKGSWRSVATHYNVFAIEHFLDELAAKGNHDPVEYRLKLLGKSERLRNVIERAADRIKWQGKVSGAMSYGVAAAHTFGSYVAEIVELEQKSEDSFRVNRIVCAIDCGIVINPDIVKQQMEGSVIFGLSAAIQSKVNIQNGRVTQSNFNDYPILRMNETPLIDVVIIDSGESPQGIGEPAVPPVAPALANALLARTSHPTLELPIRLNMG